MTAGFTVSNLDDKI